MTSVLHVHGGEPLSGTIAVRGAKNLVSKAMVAALLTPETSTLANVPDIRDVAIVADLLAAHGVNVTRRNGTVTLDAHDVERAHVADVGAHAGTSRVPILFCGPLLHRLGEAAIPDLGGDEIGGRHVDFHLHILERFGAVRREGERGLHLVADRLRGARITLPYPSVGATEQFLLTAVRAEGTSELAGAAVEPEILDLIAVLQKMGAIISVDADRMIRIEGVAHLRGYTHTALPDRIEAASWACAALATGGDIDVRGARQLDMMTFLNVYRKVGGDFAVDDGGIRFRHPGGDLASTVISTDVHPGFMTDWQQPLVVALTQARGVSIVHETVYENRMGFTDALVRMGATIQLYHECLGGGRCRFEQRNHRHSAVIAGPTPLEAADIEVPDLRGGFSQVIAALVAKGTSAVRGIDVIDRGYEHFTEKLAAVGVRTEREG